MSRISLKLYNNYESFKTTCKDFKQLTLKHQVITSLAIIALSLIMSPIAPFVIPDFFKRIVTFFKRPIPELPSEVMMRILNFVDTQTLADLAEYQIKSKPKSNRAMELMELSREELLKREHSFLSENPLVFNTMMTKAENITELNLLGFNIEQKKLNHFLGRLKNLKFLSLNGLDISGLPASLKTLNLTGDSEFKITDDWMKKLPRSLETFSIQEGSFSTISESFPLTLRHLDTGACRFDECVKILPEKLASLTISYFYPKLFERLPKSLTKLALKSFGDPQMQNVDLKSLPTTITHLELTHFSEITNEGLAELPTSIKHLTLWFCIKITDECFPYLPKSLQALECWLAGCSDSDLSSDENPSEKGLEKIKKNISCLPQSLTTLTLIRLNWLLPECTSCFPKSLIQLNVAYSFKVLNQKSIRELPKGLKKLIVSNLDFLDEEKQKMLHKRNITIQYIESFSKKDLCVESKMHMA